MSINPRAKHGSRYRRVSIEMYADEKFLKLSAPKPSAQWLWTYLLTGPFSTLIPGIVVAGQAAMAEALDWPLAAFLRCFQEIADQGMARADWRARVAFLPKALRHNLPQSPSVVMGWRQAWSEVPACGLKIEAAVHISNVLVLHGNAYSTAFVAFALSTDCAASEVHAQAATQPVDQPASQAGPHQEQEQEQEQDALPERSPVERPRARGAGNRAGVGAGTFPGDHLDHFACGPVCFTPRMAAKFIGRFGADRNRLTAWAKRVCEREQERADAGVPPAFGDDFAYWTAAYDAEFSTKGSSVTGLRTVPDVDATDKLLAAHRAARG